MRSCQGRGAKKERNSGKTKNKSYDVKTSKSQGGISLFSEEEENYESDTKDETNPYQADDEYPLPNSEAIKGKL